MGSKKLDNIQSEVEKIISLAKEDYEKLYFNAFIKNDEDVDNHPTISPYLRIGEALKNSMQVKNVRNLIACFNSGGNPLEKNQKNENGKSNLNNIEFTDIFFKRPNILDTLSTPPFCFVCASSGAGKTHIFIFS